MKEDRECWNNRFSKRPDKKPSVPGFVQQIHGQLNAGKTLDIASGDGAAALFLAGKGFEVTACDISDIALQRLTRFAKDLNLELTCVALDLDESTSFAQLDSYDNLVMTHFKPLPEYWPHFVHLLKPGGKLLLSTFNETHHTKNGFSQRFCLKEAELCEIHPQLIVEHYQSVQRGEDFMDDYLFRRID